MLSYPDDLVLLKNHLSFLEEGENSVARGTLWFVIYYYCVFVEKPKVNHACEELRVEGARGAAAARTATATPVSLPPAGLYPQLEL